MTKDTKQLIKKARKQHGLIVLNLGKHKCFARPDGTPISVTISSSTSDKGRGPKNMRADLARAGYKVR